MKLIDYVKDKVLEIFICLIAIMVVVFLLTMFNLNILLVTYIPVIMFLSYLLSFFHSFFKKKKFYNDINKKLWELDKKYYITEIIKKPDFLEGNLLYNFLYEINKSMIEDINDYKYNNEEFKDYIELWCHEIKTPITTSKLIVDNNKNKTTESILEEINKIDSYVEQVLFYARSENVEKDYIITEVNLKSIIEKVIKRNKKDLIAKKIQIEMNNFEIVNSDGKWLEFIINQILLNSIKYSNEKNAKISFDVIKNKNSSLLTIEDNGIGIADYEIDRVFDKGFTGSNGRKKYNSTGIGLYLCKKLCKRLGHEIKIESSLGKNTKVTIVFPTNSMLENIK